MMMLLTPLLRSLLWFQSLNLKRYSSVADLPLISLSDAIEALSRKPGIVVGPGVTTLPGTLTRIFVEAFKPYQDQISFEQPISGLTYRAALDTLTQLLPDQVPTIQRSIRDELQKLSGSLDLPYLAKAGWSACISLTEDVLFEAALRNYLDSKPSSLSATIIDNPAIMPHERTIPIYKMLGNINALESDSSLAITESDMLVRFQMWSQILRTFPDYLKEAPLLIIGTEAITPFVRNLLGTLLGLPRPSVSKFLFLKDDRTLIDPTIRALCSQRSVELIDASLREFCNAIADLKPMRSKSMAILIPQKQDTLSKNLSNHESIISVVPFEPIDDATTALNLPKLIDGLFRPASIDWRPFLAGLDLRRSCTDKVKNLVLEIFNESAASKLRSIVLHGEAGIGKTLLLKRVAIELSAQGLTVMWCRRALAGGYLRSYRELAQTLADHIKIKGNEEARFVLLCDDPWSLRLDASELLGCFDRFQGKLAIVFTVRNSDYFANDNSALINGVSRTTEFEIPFELDTNEITDLVAMLQRIGAARNEEEANIEVKKLSKRDAADILCSLWYLVPETRSQLTESLRDEYCRLGSIRSSVAGMAGDVARSSAVAHKAYEFVTVMSNLDIGLPIEVLVRALGVDYSEWLDMVVDGRPLWGLLYDEQETENSTVLFRTRNKIVTYILLDLVNGGVGHAGEFRVLKKLLYACEAGSGVYRTFVLDILVRARPKLEKFLTYDEGIELFEIARETLPHSDRVIEHHRGIWMHDKGHDYRNAYAQFENALQCDIYPGSERDAPQEHIHTSMAAAVLQMVKQGTQDKEHGLELVRQHLRQATSLAFFNSHTSHVAANLLFELAIQGGGATKDNISLSSLGEALQEIERAFQNIGSHVRGYSKHEKSLGMLLNLQRKILDAIPDIVRLKTLAVEKFEQSLTQIGFEVAARRMLIEANETGKGKNYNELNNYLIECKELIESKKQNLSLELISTRLDLIIRWKIQRHGQLNWREFRLDLEELLKHSVYRDNVIKQFYYAVALFQCGNLTEANASFAGLRRVHSSGSSLSPREIRCYFLNDNGDPQRFQCQIEREHLQWYVRISELNLTIPARAPGALGGPGATVHAYVGFTLNGPLAVFIKPGENDNLLA
ncbi:hypothetical protein [Undibacterium sp.]|uniref:P-loop NTPase n=1 Tax=Undibacterium sp. TaxID=1914977 RepID=UPI00273120B8|nr:hypothetical protein [Undibacterium sp.]MDP1980241.1 hypothetical protein [Undibacterium sp.]